MPDPEPTTSSGVLNDIIEEIIKILTFAKPVPEFMKKVFDFVPNLLQIDESSLARLYFKNITAIVVLILCIVTMNDRAHDNMLNNETPEAILFALFLLLIFMFTINTVQVFLSNQYGNINTFSQELQDFLIIPAPKIAVYVVNFILIAIFVSVIAGVTNKKSLKLGSNEAIVFSVFSTLILLLIINTIFTYYKENKDWKGFELFLYAKSLFFDLPLNIIIFFFSLLIWITLNLPSLIIGFFNGIFEIIVTMFTSLGEMLQNPDDAKTVYKYGMLYAVIFSIIIILYYALLDPAALKSNTFTYAMMIIIPLILVLGVVTPFSRKQGGGTTMFIIGTVVAFFAALLYFYSKATSATYELMNYITIFLVVAMSITGLAIFFYILGNYLKSLPGWAGFMVYFIFYLPCLFIDFVKYIMNEFKMTANPIFVLLIIELVVLILYYYLPTIMEKINTSRKNVLLPGSAFLDVSQKIGSSEINKLPRFIADQNDLSEPVYTQNYAFSMWIYLNPQATNYIGYAGESTIFSYNSDEAGGKPKITYFNDMTVDSNNFGKSGIDQYCVYFSNKKTPIGKYKFSMPGQKWNNLVINFTSSRADLFVNGKLEYTYNFKDNEPSYGAVDYATIGQEKGVDGAICNVVYHPNNLSLIEIANNYNLLSLRNPPTYT